MPLGNHRLLCISPLTDYELEAEADACLQILAEVGTEDAALELYSALSQLRLGMGAEALPIGTPLARTGLGGLRDAD
jgi:hypothetical protein